MSDFITAELPFSLEIEGYNILVVHAGLLPGVPLQQQQLSHMYKMRDVQQQPDGEYTGMEKAAEGSQPWATAWKGPHHVFFGHDAKRRLQRELQVYTQGVCMEGSLLPVHCHLLRSCNGVISSQLLWHSWQHKQAAERASKLPTVVGTHKVTREKRLMGST